MKPTHHARMARLLDPSTSHEAAIGASKRTVSQKTQLLVAYYLNPEGLTDEEAGQITGLINKPRCGYWKRCSELEREGFLIRTLLTRVGAMGNHLMVRTITDKGIKEVENL